MNRKALLSVVLSLIIVLLFCFSALASKQEDMTPKMKAHKELVENGTIADLEEKFQAYYLNNPLSREEIEQNMAKTFTSDDIGTQSIGIDPPTGRNDISFSDFEDADIIVVHDGDCAYGYWRHAGTYDSSRGNFISAQLGEGVLRESKSKYKKYDEAAGLTVNGGSTSNREDIMSFLEDQLGEPFGFTNYGDWSNWYCSKLPWVGWYEECSIRVNDNGGLCVPDDIYDDNNTTLFAYDD